MIRSLSSSCSTYCCRPHFQLQNLRDFIKPLSAKIQCTLSARACKRVCRVPCDLQVARDPVAEQNAAVDGAVLIVQNEAAQWQQGMAIQASTAAAILAAVTAAAAREALAACERRETRAVAREAAVARKACEAHEATAKKEAEVNALEEAVANERARKEAETKAHQKALVKAQGNAAKREAIKV